MPLLDDFLARIGSFIRDRDSASLQQWLKVEPPLPQSYTDLATELRSKHQNNETLEAKVVELLPESDTSDPSQGDVWPGFHSFMVVYMRFWRDVNFDNLLETHVLLSTLVNACNTALSNSMYGILVLPTTITLSSALATLARTLDKRPDLTRRLRKTGDPEESNKSLVERTAETIQRAFTICLSERTSNPMGVGADGRPEGKKIGIYSFANLVLKLLFQSKKTRPATQLFTNIAQQSPRLTLYPASQRVTYLYYLGRFLFSNDHYFRAQACLEAAYGQCHRQCLRQKRLVAIHLITCNIILGRFPSRTLLAKPECQGLDKIFIPICQAMQQGDMPAFKALFDRGSYCHDWLLSKKIYLQLLFRGEVIVWRSLARKTFLLTYHFPADQASNIAPTLHIDDMVVAAMTCQFNIQAKHGGKLNEFQRLIWDTEMNGTSDSTDAIFQQVEAILASLVAQGLLRGYISHGQQKFAILGSKQRGGPLMAGFPPVWNVVRKRALEESKTDPVPGWVVKESATGTGGVVNLTGIARPVGAQG